MKFPSLHKEKSEENPEAADSKHAPSSSSKADSNTEENTKSDSDMGNVADSSDKTGLAKEEKREGEDGKAENDARREPVQETQQQAEAVEAEERAARLRLYRRDDVRRFASWILRGHDEIRPERNPATGEYDYSRVGFDHREIGPLLTELESHYIMRRSIVDTAPACPKCANSNFHVGYRCPFCQHTTLMQGTMIEHYPCGHTDFEDKFKSASGLMCPKCRRMLKMIGTDYRKIEHSYRCIVCGKNFGTPEIQFLCRTCGKANNENELLMEPVYGYSLNEDLRSELIAHCSLEAKVTEFFKERGFEVTAPKTLEGLSGTVHSFDLEAKKGETEIVLDMVSSTGEVSPQDVMAFFAKVYDAKPSTPIMVAMPRVSKEALSLGAMYGVEIIAADDPDRIISKLAKITGSVAVPEPPIVRTMPTQPSKTQDKEYARGRVSSAAEEPVITLRPTLTQEQLKSSATGKDSAEELREPDDILRLARNRMAKVMVETKQQASR